MSNYRIKLNNVTISFLLIPYLFPTGIIHLVPKLNFLLDCWMLASVIVIILIFIISRKVSKIIISIALYATVTLVSTLINGRDFWQYIVSYGKIITLCMLIEICIVQQAKKLFWVMTNVLAIEVLANLYSILRYPSGMYLTLFTRNWLLGYDNLHYTYIFPLLCISMIYAEYKKIPFLVKFLIVMLFSASIYITWSAASVVAVTIWILLWLFMEIFHNTKILNINKMILIHSVFFVGIVIWRLQNIFSWLIVDILGKNLTFTGRTLRWDIAIQKIKEHPFWGWGVSSKDVMMSVLNGFSHCHNHILQILYQSGIIGLVCFVIVLFVIKKPLMCVRNGKYGSIIVNTLFCFLMVGQVEALTNMTTYFSVITIAYHIEKMEECLESEKKQSRFRFIFGMDRWFKAMSDSQKGDVC